MIECRICGSDLEDGTSVCPTCGRMVVHYPEQLPETLQECLDKEKEIYKKLNASEGDLQRDLKTKEKEIEELKREIEGLNGTITEKDIQISSLSKELQDKNNYIDYWICPNCKIPYQVGAKNCTKCNHKRPQI